MQSMASGTMPAQPGDQFRRGHPSSNTQVGGTTQGSRWVPVALALGALAGVTAIELMRGQFDRRKAGSKRQGRAAVGEPEVERSITIGKSADELYERWRDPNTLSRIMADFATVHANGDGRMHWNVEGSLGRAYEWETETAEDRPGEGFGWRSLPDAVIPNEGSVRFRQAPADRGTVATLRLRFDPPGGALGDVAVDLLGTTPLNLAVDGALRRFKSLTETGEIPTTERQPAARADTR
jgi:uncharacterized membrane protein